MGIFILSGVHHSASRKYCFKRESLKVDFSLHKLEHQKANTCCWYDFQYRDAKLLIEEFAPASTIQPYLKLALLPSTSVKGADGLARRFCRKFRLPFLNVKYAMDFGEWVFNELISLGHCQYSMFDLDHLQQQQLHRRITNIEVLVANEVYLVVVLALPSFLPCRLQS